MSADVYLVTGGSRGIGRTIVERLVAGGQRVAFTWKDNQDAARAVEDAAQGLARAYHLDLADHERPRSVVSEIEEGWGPLLGLVNNAGFQRSELLAMTSDDSWDEILDVNLGGAFRCTKAVLRGGMLSRRHGAIVTISSLSALHGVAGHSAYGAAKAGMLAMTRCLAREMGKRGVRVNAVAAGYVRTEMTASLAPEVVADLRADECLDEGTSAADVADAVLFLLSERAAAITGQTLVVDAGTTA